MDSSISPTLEHILLSEEQMRHHVTKTVSRIKDGRDFSQGSLRDALQQAFVIQAYEDALLIACTTHAEYLGRDHIDLLASVCLKAHWDTRFVETRLIISPHFDDCLLGNVERKFPGFVAKLESEAQTRRQQAKALIKEAANLAAQAGDTLSQENLHYAAVECIPGMPPDDTPATPAWVDVAYPLIDKLSHAQTLHLIQSIKEVCSPPETEESGIPTRFIRRVSELHNLRRDHATIRVNHLIHRLRKHWEQHGQDASALEHLAHALQEGQATRLLNLYRQHMPADVRMTPLIEATGDAFFAQAPSGSVYLAVSIPPDNSP